MQTERQDSRQWRYCAEDSGGAVVKGALDAVDLQRAVARLKEQGLAPINIEEERPAKAQLFSPHRKSGHLSANDTTQFCARMADLLNAGVTASKALALIADQARRKSLKEFAGRLHHKIRKGEALSVALKEDPTSPPRIMIALVASGEALGDMGGQFARLAKSFETRAALQKEIISQLIYPAALFVLILLTMVFLSFFVLPQFETVFLTASASPPAETRFVLAAGAFIRAYWLAALLGGGALILLAQFLIARNRRGFEKTLLSAPILGLLIRKIETARYCRSLGELLSGGMPLARAMPIAHAALANSHLRDGVGVIEAEIRNGAPLSKAAMATPVLAHDAVSFFELGEETGDLGAMIEKAADYLEQQITVSLKRFAALAGPIMTAIMGLMTAGVIAAVMAGVLSLNDAVY